jgi:hypothetical protein
MKFQTYTSTSNALVELTYNIIDMEGNEGAPREINIEITAATLDGETVTVSEVETLLDNSRLERLIANSL